MGPPGGASGAQAAEIERLRAENARLRQKLAEGSGGGGPWGEALLEELRVEVCDERRTFCLKNELCNSARRRHLLEEAVRARHAGLERLAGCSPEDLHRPGQLDHALSAGAAEARTAASDGGGPARRGTKAQQPLPASMTMDSVFEAEQHLLGLAGALAPLVQGNPPANAAASTDLCARVLSRIDAYAPTLLECGADLPLAVPQRAAALRRQLRRQLCTPPAIAPDGGKYRPREDPVDGWTDGAGGGASVMNRRGVCSVLLPEELMLAWRDAFEAAADERQARASIELGLREMAEVAAEWALQLEAVRG